MWTLITVTDSGEVHESHHATKRLCEQAQNIALTGMTLEENEAADKAYAEYLKKLDEDHPWRDPKNDFERQLVESGALFGSVSYGGPYSLSYNGSTKKVREYPGGARGRCVKKYRTDVKYAKCVPPEDVHSAVHRPEV